MQEWYEHTSDADGNADGSDNEGKSDISERSRSTLRRLYPNSALVYVCSTLLLAPKSAALQ